jgi:CelD/BcsL family acetyltransferase involved in cellulose biosynthesis
MTDIRTIEFPTTAESCGARLTVTERRVGELDAALIEDWRRLAERASEPNSFQEPWFVRAGLDHLTDDRDLRLIEVRNGALLGVAVMAVHNDYGRIPAPHVRNWRHHNDFLGTPLVRRGRERDFWAALLDHLDGSAWAPGFLHVNGLVEDGPVHAGLREAATALRRPAAIVARVTRAALASRLGAAEYLETTVRKKKRKELTRLTRRLGEQGDLVFSTLPADEDPGRWCDDFLALERAGWKGRARSALASNPRTEAFFRQAVAEAARAGRLQFRRLNLDGQAIAMLINFLAPPGSFSFKIAYDEAFARFSPGVLLQLDNLDVLARPDIEWMDSCATQNHPMIDSLWSERRSIVRLSVPLAGARRMLAYASCRAIEGSWAAGKRVLGRKP